MRATAILSFWLPFPPLPSPAFKFCFLWHTLGIKGAKAGLPRDGLGSETQPSVWILKGACGLIVLRLTVGGSWERRRRSENLQNVSNKHDDYQLFRICTLPLLSLLSRFSTVFDFFPKLNISLANIDSCVVNSNVLKSIDCVFCKFLPWSQTTYQKTKGRSSESICSRILRFNPQE